jgi:hypothetical protein
MESKQHLFLYVFYNIIGNSVGKSLIPFDCFCCSTRKEETTTNSLYIIFFIIKFFLYIYFCSLFLYFVYRMRGLLYTNVLSFMPLKSKTSSVFFSFFYIFSVKKRKRRRVSDIILYKLLEFVPPFIYISKTMVSP